MMSEELWRPINNYEGIYEISNTGKVKSLKTGKLRKFSNSTKYLQVTLCKNGNSEYKWVHRLVAEHFIENTNNYPIVNHKDGNKLNNNVDNLEFCTAAENNKHAGVLNLKPIGTKHTNSNFSKEDLLKIKNLHSDGLTHREIAKIFKVNKTSITNYLSGKTYIKEYINE
jgi:hypothetical protein